MKVTIAKLLKEKNRTASEIKKLKQKILVNNVILAEEGVEFLERDVNTLELSHELSNLIEKLVLIKSAIHSGNVKSADKIYRLAEIKGQIALFESLNCTSEVIRSRFDSGPRERYYPCITEYDRAATVNSLTKTANLIQDQLDEFNATHRVEVPDDLIS